MSSCRLLLHPALCRKGHDANDKTGGFDDNSFHGMQCDLKIVAIYFQLLIENKKKIHYIEIGVGNILVYS